MTLIELKESLHQKIEDISDEHVLEQVAAILDKKEEAFVLPEFMRAGIEQGRRDIENGDFITLENLEKKYEKWLNE